MVVVPAYQGLGHVVQGHAAAVTHITINERSNQIISLSADKVVKVLLLPLLFGVIHYLSLSVICHLSLSTGCQAQPVIDCS